MVSNSNILNTAASDSLSFDQSKEKYRTIQTSLAVDNSDSINDLTVLLNWIEYFKRGFCSEDEKQFLLVTVLPKVTRILLKRKYAENSKTYTTNIVMVQEYLIQVVNIIGNFFNYNHECFSCLMAELFDATQPFYQKYSTIKFDPVYIFGDMPTSSSTAASNPPAPDVIILGNEANTASSSSAAAAPSSSSSSSSAAMKWVEDIIPQVNHDLYIYISICISMYMY